MGDPVTGLLIALGLDPIAFVVSLGLAIATTALTSFMLSAPARGRLWAAVLLIGGSLLLADRVHAQRQEPAVIILCASGGVSRLNDGGFLAPAAPASCTTGKVDTLQRTPSSCTTAHWARPSF